MDCRAVWAQLRQSQSDSGENIKSQSQEEPIQTAKVNCQAVDTDSLDIAGEALRAERWQTQSGEDKGKEHADSGEDRFWGLAAWAPDIEWVGKGLHTCEREAKAGWFEAHEEVG